VTDDTAAIKRAVDTVCGAGTGGTLVIPRGTCLISPSQTTGKTFTIYSKCIIIGYGNESILKVKDNAGNYGAIFGHDAAQTYSENLTFANFKIDQNADGQQARVGCVSNCQNHSPKPNCADSCTSVSASDCQNVSGFCQQIPIVHFNASSPTVTNVSVDTATG